MNIFPQFVSAAHRTAHSPARHALGRARNRAGFRAPAPRPGFQSRPAVRAVLVPIALLVLAGAALRPSPAPIPSQAPATPQTPMTLTPEMTFNRWSLSDLQLSPDEKLLALVVSEPAKPTGQRRNIWLYDLSARVLKPFTSSPKSDTRPRWSPDGRTLAFLSDREGENQVYLIPADGGEARPLTESKTGIDGFAWSPDGKEILLVTTSPKTDAEEKKEKDKDDVRLVGRENTRALLQVIDVASKSLRVLVQGNWEIEGYVWMPDGASLLVSATDDPRHEIFSSKIYRVSASDGKMTLLATPAGPFGNLRVSPDGKTLAFTGCRSDGPQGFDLFVFPLPGGPARNLTAASLDRPVLSFAWDDPARLFALAYTGFGDAFYDVKLDGKAAKSAWTTAMLAGTYAKGKTALAYTAETSVEAPELWIAASPGAPAEKVSRFNKDWDAVRLVEPEIVTYPSFDKRKIEAALFKPAAPAPASGLPLVIVVHGGPTGAWTNRFNSWAQLLVAHGFAVLCPNIRGSTGYGYDFMVLNRKDWGGGDFKDVMAGADDMIRRGVADPKRLGIGGWSYGGYMAAWAVTQTDRFKASVSGAPMTDLAVEYGAEEAGINAYDTWFMGNPYENLALFNERSPVTYVKRVKTPTLILCGENDTTDPIAQCYEFHRGLMRFGVETELAAYPREGHGVREEKHALDVLDRMTAWFEKYLKK